MINFPQSQAEGPSAASTPPEIKGKEIGKMLAASPLPSVAASSPPQKKTTTLTRKEILEINNVYADLL